MSLINVDFPNKPGGQPGGAGPMPTQARSDAYSLDLFDLIKRKFWIILFFILLGLAATLLYFFKAPKTYQSTARIFVDEKNASVMNNGDGDSFVSEASIEKYLVTLKSTKIISPAIEKGAFHEFETFRDCDDILAELRDEKTLLAKPADSKANSGVIKLSFKGPDAEECKKVLERVVASFDDHIKSTTKSVGGETASLVTQVKNDIFKQLDQVEAELAELKTQPGFLVVDGRVVNPHFFYF